MKSSAFASTVLAFSLALGLFSSTARAQNAAAPATPDPDAPATKAPPVTTQHPALFLIGDSIMVTGNGDTAPARGPWGFGHELLPMFDSSKIHGYNLALGGRSSRGFMDEGAWAKALDRMQPGDFAILMFGHNDQKNSTNYPDRATIMGGGNESVVVGADANAYTIYTYGAYLRQYVTDAKAKGVTLIVLSPTPRNQWTAGKINRGFDGYAGWAADAAKATGAPFIDLNTIAANRYDALGQQAAAAYFGDTQHPSALGAKLIAESVVEGLKQINSPLVKDLLPAAAAPAPVAK